jgi:hypothetical protein
LQTTTPGFPEFSSGRKDFPLLFGMKHEPKKAFYSVMDF